MSDKHLQEIRSFYEALGPIDLGFGSVLDPEARLSMISMAALETVPEEESISIHCSGFHLGPNRSVQVFVTDKAIRLVQTGVFKKEKILGSERVLPKSITGVERKRGGINSPKGHEWEIVLSRTVEQDKITQLSDKESEMIVQHVENWLEAPGGEPPTPEGPAEKLKKLKELLDAGIISQEEFEEKKAPLIQEL